MLADSCGSDASQVLHYACSRPEESVNRGEGLNREQKRLLGWTRAQIMTRLGEFGFALPANAGRSPVVAVEAPATAAERIRDAVRGLSGGVRGGRVGL